MSGTLGHSLVPQALCHPYVSESKDHLGISRNLSCGVSLASKADQVLCNKGKPLLSTKFLDKGLTVTKVKLSWRTRRAAVTMVPRAVLATDPSSELAGKFNLDGHAELEVAVSASAPISVLQIHIQITNSSGSAILHWGLICEGKNKWMLPSRHPDGTQVYKNRALRTPFVKAGPNSFLKLEIDDPDVQALEFLILDETQNKWFKNNGQNFRIQLPRRDNMKQNVSLNVTPPVLLPEDLVQIHAYLRWERKGKQQYTPEQEKEEYEAARAELLQEIARGVSVEELRAKLTKKTSEAKEPDTPEQKIPNELVQVQAYIRWEKAGKPNYSQEKQLMEFEEARKELQLELDKGISLEELRKKIMKGNIQSKVSKQLEKKNYFTIERIQRKKRDIMQLINKYTPDDAKKRISYTSRTPTILESFAKSKEEQDGDHIVYKKSFKLDNKELLVLVTKPSGKMKVYIATDSDGPLVLHWALSKAAGEWMLPPSSTLPPGSVLLDISCETPFVKSSLPDLFYQAVEIQIDGDDFVGMPFVLVSDGNWIKDCDSDFYIDFSNESMKTKKEAGDGRGTAKDLLEKIAEMESDAERSLMHRFNIAADLMEWAGDFGELGLAGILVWMRFMATRQLKWNKNYNVKPRSWR
uniref:Alpha-glucan water dikinase, chloroplastic n=1 Tax=Anthurium amnicola TaxID=1678845 RepID=A0A1D1ZGH5_9ARAE